MKITVKEYGKLMEMQGRAKALKDFIKSQEGCSRAIRVPGYKFVKEV